MGGVLLLVLDQNVFGITACVQEDVLGAARGKFTSLHPRLDDWLAPPRENTSRLDAIPSLQEFVLRDHANPTMKLDQQV